VEVVIGVLVIWILYAVIRKSPRRWWLYFWGIAVPLTVLGAVAEPLILEPLFFKFTPLANSQPHLAERIESVVKRAGLEIPQSHMFVMNASSKLKAVNAYASGLGATKRVVVWDTSIQRMTEDEILFVFGHEMGHYVLGHVRNGILFFCGVLLFFLVSRLSHPPLDARPLGRDLVHPRRGRPCFTTRVDPAADGLRFPVHSDFKCV